MVAANLLPLADVVSTLIGAYWVCLIIGGGLLLVSVLGGLGHGTPDVDAHAGLDFHTDVGHADVGAGDVHVDTGHADASHADASHMGGLTALSTWLSVRFVVFFIAAFGAFGVILTHVTHAGATATIAVALIGGLLVGQGAHQFFRMVQRTSGDSTPQPHDYVNRLGRVTIRIAAPDPGEVAVHVLGAERYLPALATGATQSFSVGDDVVIVGYRTGMAQVVSKEEFERLRRST